MRCTCTCMWHRTLEEGKDLGVPSGKTTRKEKSKFKYDLQIIFVSQASPCLIHAIKTIEEYSVADLRDYYRYSIHSLSKLYDTISTLCLYNIT